MKYNQAEINHNQLLLKGNKSPLLIRATLTVVLLICILIPIAATYFLISERKGPHIGIVLSFFFFWGIGFYLLRIILWNTFGREIIILEKDKILYEADYRFFKDGKQTISTENIEVVAVPTEDKTENLAILNFSNKQQHINTVLKVSLDKMRNIAQEINNRY
tara:strand:+ start:47 stop:532 length:486 start_codon:yes stop_codon:yes gene_type:complete